MRFSDLAGKRVAVWGYGIEGKSTAAHLDHLGVSYRVVTPDDDGVTPVDALTSVDVVIKSPGISPLSVEYQHVTAAGIPITSLTNLWLNDNAERTIAVTGTKGKSTTSSLIAHILNAAGTRASLVGNIGTSVLAETEPRAEVAVLELSSYQAQSLTISPRILVVTSLFPEHLTWHGGEEAYYRDKLSAAAHGVETVIAPGDAPHIVSRLREIAPQARMLLAGVDGVSEVDGGVAWDGGPTLTAEQLPLAGRHQAVNIALASLAARECGVTAQQSADAVLTFQPLEGRSEVVPSSDGRVWIDDGLATVPQAVVAALQARTESRIAVLLGGADRGVDFIPLYDYLREHPEVDPILLGPAGERMLAESGLGTHYASFTDAMVYLTSPTNPADAVLLSPSAPSFDEFTDYKERGQAFRAAASTARPRELG